MKSKLFLLQLTVALTVCSAQGQDTFIYDQSSATNPAAGGGGAPIQADQPMGQSFTPALSSIDFVQLNFTYGGFPSNQLGAAVFVNLWSGSISNGTLLSSTDPVFIPDGAFRLVTNLFFSASVALTPGDTYFLQPYLQSGDTRLGVIDSTSFNYPGGTFYFNGEPDPNNQDLWFREGIIAAPEPSSAVIILLGTVGLYFCRKNSNKPLR
jgi:hypothetical protein